MSDRFFIRPASVEDLPSLGGIQEESSKLFPPERIPDSAPLPTPDDFRPSLEERLLFVATSEEALVGFSQSEMSRNSLYLSQVESPRVLRRLV